MKLMLTTAAALLLAGTFGLPGLAPALAQDASGANPTTPSASAPADDNGAASMAPAHRGGQRGWHMQKPGSQARMGGMHRGGRTGGDGGLVGAVFKLGCGDSGAEALEIAFVRLQYAVKPNATQQPLLDALKSSALADQKNVATACATARPGGANASNSTRPNMLDRMQARLAVQTARVTALNDILPKFRSFYDSLDDQQKSRVTGQPRTHFGMGGADHAGGWQGHRGAGPHGMPPGHPDMVPANPPPPPGGPANPPVPPSDSSQPEHWQG